MRLSAPIYTLKRQAKLLARVKGIKLYEALNQIAQREGHRDWSYLASCYSKETPAKVVLSQLNSGNMVLIGARPGHGKTLLGLELAALAKKNGRRSYVFSLDYNDTDVQCQLGKLGLDLRQPNDSVVVDTSDSICADHIAKRLGTKPVHAFVVIDYLQLLDQKRTSPPLDDQVRALKRLAIESGAVVVLTSQIDRSFELASNDMPTLTDIRLPNPVDLSLFDVRCFLHQGQIQIEVPA